MNKHTVTAALVALLLAGIMRPTGVLAKDKSDTLQKVEAKDRSKAKSETPVQTPAPASTERAREAKPDTFIDRDNNGIDDRHERKVVRPDQKSKPPVKEGTPQQSAPPKRNAPPGRQKS